MISWSYEGAFTRNLGWVTEWEQDALRGKRVAIAGLGGVGGQHLLTLTRLGVGKFNIADFDKFDLVNFNRQAGATTASVGRLKLDVMAEMALGVNPELELGRFPSGVDAGNVDSFLDGVDLFVDGLDFFVLDIRALVFRRCAEKGIPAITAAPIGMGTNWLIFLPNGMSFEQYFRLESQAENERYLRFLVGLAPSGVHRRYLVDPTRVDLKGKRGPSTSASCQLCAGVVGVEAIKLLLRRDGVRPAPFHHHFDPYTGTARQTIMRWGMGGPVQRVKLALARRFYLRELARESAATIETAVPEHSPAVRVLMRARWAPSGDNAQSWRFEITDVDRMIVRMPISGNNPYEYRGSEPSILALGMLVETMRLAASREERGLEYVLRSGAPIALDVHLPERPGLKADPLDAMVAIRSVERRALLPRRLRAEEKTELEAALGPYLKLQLYETAEERWRIARLSAAVTNIRLRAPELFPVHQQMVDWTDRYSPGGLPSGALGLDRATLQILRWAMVNWTRMRWLNRILGTAAAEAQLDLWPGLRCAAAFAIAPVGQWHGDTSKLIEIGGALQRFWLTATRIGLAIQPASALLLVAQHGLEGKPLTADKVLSHAVSQIAERFAKSFGTNASTLVFVGRVGERPTGLPRARSTRRPLSDLMT